MAVVWIDLFLFVMWYGTFAVRTLLIFVVRSKNIDVALCSWQTENVPDGLYFLDFRY